MQNLKKIPSAFTTERIGVKLGMSVEDDNAHKFCQPIFDHGPLTNFMHIFDHGPLTNFMHIFRKSAKIFALRV